MAFGEAINILDTFEVTETAQSTNLLKFLRRTRLWKSIILSSVGETAYPYCLYIQSLNLKLECLIDDARNYSGKDLDFFFEAGMARFIRFKATSNDPSILSERSVSDIDLPKTSELIGVSILSYISEAAKQSGTILNLIHLRWYNDAGMLTGWISQMSNLITLEITSRNTSDLEDLARAISDNCSEFQRLTVMVNSQTEREKEDKIPAQFLSRLKQKTLRHFATYPVDIILEYVHCSVGLRKLVSLNHHAETLSSLMLYGVNRMTFEILFLLNACKNLTRIWLLVLRSLELRRSETGGQRFVGWICSCRSLRDLSMRNLSTITDILTPALSKDCIRHQKLDISLVDFTDNEFFAILSTQIALKHLNILGSIKYSCRAAMHNLCKSLPHLTNLKILNIRSSDKDNRWAGDFFRELNSCYGIKSLQIENTFLQLPPGDRRDVDHNEKTASSASFGNKWNLKIYL
ncbi:hypothetical protein K3495_g12559 [Podosphaera aphanis]|nr:hypothetical protein K3495_g12559 [Podosphaera aphanis]